MATRASSGGLRRGLGGLAVAVVCISSRAQAAAEDASSAAETAAARALAIEGVKLADAGRCDQALERLARAEKLHHAPVVLGRLGECQVIVGKLVEGTENLRRVLREPLAAGAPAVVLRARERAQIVLDGSIGRIGFLNIVVRGPSDLSLIGISVDGQPMNAALLGADRPTDPGEHVIEARARGFSQHAARVTLLPGGHQNVVIDLVPHPAPSRVGPRAARGPHGFGIPSERVGWPGPSRRCGRALTAFAPVALVARNIQSFWTRLAAPPALPGRRRLAV